MSQKIERSSIPVGMTERYSNKSVHRRAHRESERPKAASILVPWRVKDPEGLEVA